MLNEQKSKCRSRVLASEPEQARLVSGHKRSDDKWFASVLVHSYSIEYKPGRIWSRLRFARGLHTNYFVSRFSFFFMITFALQLNSYLVSSFTLSGLFLDGPWSQVSSLLHSGTCLHCLSHVGFSLPTARRFPSKAPNSSCRVFRYSIFIQAHTSMHSVRLEPTKLILAGTRTTY